MTRERSSPRCQEGCGNGGPGQAHLGTRRCSCQSTSHKRGRQMNVARLGYAVMVLPVCREGLTYSLCFKWEVRPRFCWGRSPSAWLCWLEGWSSLAAASPCLSLLHPPARAGHQGTNWIFICLPTACVLSVFKDRDVCFPTTVSSITRLPGESQVLSKY